MHKLKRCIIYTGIIFLFLLLASALVYKNLSKETSREFQESDRRLINPDRGFYIQVNSRNYETISDAAKEVRVILLGFDMEEYTKGDLPEEKLRELETALRTAVDEHVAVIFRAAYGFHGEVVEPDSIEEMGRHIEQISQVLNSYADQILVVQAGMLGDYGEWHSSRYLEGDEEAQKKSRLYILKQWEENLSPQIKVAVRRPRFIREALEEGILTDRLGFHNDGLLASDTDLGTYDAPEMTREDELLWMQENLTEQVNGGEMPILEEWNLPENADKEFAQMHIGYLNLKYNEEVINSWASEEIEGLNAKSYLENHLGYRLFLSELSMRSFYFEKELSRNSVKIKLRLCNTGYAALPSHYKIFLTVNAGEEWVYQELVIDKLYEISNGESVEKEVKVQIPEELVRENEMLKFGLKIVKGKETEETQNCVELANSGFSYEKGVNGIASLDRKNRWFFAFNLPE